MKPAKLNVRMYIIRKREISLSLLVIIGDEVELPPYNIRWYASNPSI